MTGRARRRGRLTAGRGGGRELQLVNVANYDAAVCRPTPVRGLRVYPPGDTASLFVAAEGTGCAGTPPGDQLSVQTLTARLIRGSPVQGGALEHLVHGVARPVHREPDQVQPGAAAPRAPRPGWPRRARCRTARR